MTGTALAPDAQRVWRAARGPAAVLLLIIAAAVVVTLVRAPGDGGVLDPDSTAPSGSRALARLLAAEGVQVRPARSVADADRLLAGSGDTLLITTPGLLDVHHLTRLTSRAGEIVLIGPEQATVDTLGLSVHAEGRTPVTVRTPGCALESAVAAGSVTLGGVRYRTSGAPSEVELCYRDGAAATMVHIGDVTLLGARDPLTNAALAEEGNAALTMRLLGQHERLVWFLPSADDPGLAGRRSFLDLLPAGWVFGLITVGLAVLLLALWRARRLGPVVVEPLPVAVPAAETVRGRASLYRRARAADHAADALRQATIRRLAHRIGLPRGAAAEAVAGALARRTERGEAELRELLYGPAPAGDAALVRLADALDALEREVLDR